MSPTEDALLLLGLVRRHLRALKQTLDPDYPDENWGFTAQLEQLLPLAQVTIPPVLLQLQVFAVEARYAEGPFPLPAPRGELLALLQAELKRLEQAIAEADGGSRAPARSAG